MKYKQGLYPVIEKENPAADVYSLTIYCPDIASVAVCGQFVNIRTGNCTLRRPISICRIYKDSLRIVFQVRGKGTEQLAEIRKGELIDMVAPLGGRGFTLDSKKKAILIGGGIGTPPLLEAAHFYGKKAAVICGFRSGSAVILRDDFISTGAEYILCTDDGSDGRKGFVTDALAEMLDKSKPDIICACGPMAMLRGVAGLAEKAGVECQVSLEERMACGVGGCLVCACRTVRDGKEIYAHVCKDGPVFSGKEVIFDERQQT